MSTTQPYQRMKRYEEAQGDRGYVRVSVWVPAKARESLRAYANKLRSEGSRRTRRG